MAQKSAPQGAQAALRALRLLKLFTPERPELKLAEVSTMTGLNKTTTHRLLQALHSESMLDRNPNDGAYRLGPTLMALGVQALSSNDLRLRARPLLKKMAQETGETATLEIPVEDTFAGTIAHGVNSSDEVILVCTFQGDLTAAIGVVP